MYGITDSALQEIALIIRVMDASEMCELAGGLVLVEHGKDAVATGLDSFANTYLIVIRGSGQFS